jgi:hypothetical protein
MGQTLIEAFTRQLGGEIAMSGPPGTVSTLVFQLETVLPPAGPERAADIAPSPAAHSHAPA